MMRLDGLYVVLRRSEGFPFKLNAVAAAEFIAAAKFTGQHRGRTRSGGKMLKKLSYVGQ